MQGCSRAAWSPALLHQLNDAMLAPTRLVRMSARFSDRFRDTGRSLRTVFACMGVLLISSFLCSPSRCNPPISLHPVPFWPPTMCSATYLSGTQRRRHPCGPDPPISHDGEPAQLFGMETEAVTGGATAEKWRPVKADVTHQFEIVAQLLR
jgi:hypothetical protein